MKFWVAVVLAVLIVMAYLFWAEIWFVVALLFNTVVYGGAPLWFALAAYYLWQMRGTARPKPRY